MVSSNQLFPFCSLAENFIPILQTQEGPVLQVSFRVLACDYSFERVQAGPLFYFDSNKNAY